MKLPVITLCICLGQACFGSTEVTKERIRNCVNGVGDQFVDDFMAMYEAYQDYFLNSESLIKLLDWLSKIAPKDKNAHIDVNSVRNLNYSIIFQVDGNNCKQEAKLLCDHMKIYQSMYSERFPSKRYDGIMNVYYIILNPDATTNEINIALNYLYGIDVVATNTSFFDNLPELTGKDCPDIVSSYSKVIDKLKTMYHIRLKVMQDFTTIRDKFPCTDDVLHQLQRFLDLLLQFDGDKSKINACKIHEGSPEQFSTEITDLRLQILETILPTRLSDEVFRGILRFENATLPDTPIKEIEKALEYLYDDVPKCSCPCDCDYLN